MVQHIQDVGAVGDGVIGEELQLRRIAQIKPLPQLPPQIAAGGFQTLQKVLFVGPVHSADVDPGIPQVRRGVHVGDGQQRSADPGIFHRAHKLAQLFLDLVVDTTDTIGSHGPPPFKNVEIRCITAVKIGRAKRPPDRFYCSISSIVKASMMSPSLMSLNFSMVMPHS